MRSSRFLVVVLFGVGVLFAMGCSQPTPCSAANCSGCCSATNQCLGGNDDSACGAGGAMCGACSASVCVNAMCVVKVATDAGMDAGVDDAGTGDAGQPDVDSQLAAVRAAADADAGAVMLPIDGVLVTYLKPLVPDAGATDPAGFFVQNSTTGPGLFVAVDPASVTGGPVAVGDQLAFTVTQVARVGTLRMATAVSGLSKSSSGNPVSSLVQDVSAVSLSSPSDIDGYESKLISLTGQVVSQPASSGSGYRAVQFTSVGTPALADGGSSMQLRMVASLSNAEALSPGCSVALNGTPLWRFNTRAQPSAFVMSELSGITCPAPRLQTARASAATTVVATFDRNLDPTTVTAAAFTVSGPAALAVSAATLTSPFRVTLTTEAQTVGAAYTLLVASTVTDVRGTAIDSSANMASFTGFDPATLDAGMTSDGGNDAGVTSDGGNDAGVTDAGATDAGVTDAGMTDAGVTDAGVTDAGMTDAGTTCMLPNLLISEIRSRGAGGASDEFVELFNPTAAPITLDATWALSARSTTTGAYATRYAGTGIVVPAHGHALIVGTGYTQMPTRDDVLLVGLTDATSLVLLHNGMPVDAVCFGFDATTLAAFATTSFVCGGTPANNSPHDNTSSNASSVDVSLERKPGGALGNCTDSKNNAMDFVTQTPATPMSTASPLTP
jgi:hypothetical protein